MALLCKMAGNWRKRKYLGSWKNFI